MRRLETRCRCRQVQWPLPLTPLRCTAHCAPLRVGAAIRAAALIGAAQCAVCVPRRLAAQGTGTGPLRARALVRSVRGHWSAPCMALVRSVRGTGPLSAWHRSAPCAALGRRPADGAAPNSESARTDELDPRVGPTLLSLNIAMDQMNESQASDGLGAVGVTRRSAIYNGQHLDATHNIVATSSGCSGHRGCNELWLQRTPCNSVSQRTTYHASQSR